MSSKTLHIGKQTVDLSELKRSGSTLHFVLDGTHYHFRSTRLPDGSTLLEQEMPGGQWQRIVVDVHKTPRGAQLALGGLEVLVSEAQQSAAAEVQNALCPRAPMPGQVRKILVAAGDRVAAGQALLVVEAMKLQMTLSAGGAGSVEAVLAQEGDMVAEGAELLRMVAADG